MPLLSLSLGCVPSHPRGETAEWDRRNQFSHICTSSCGQCHERELATFREAPQGTEQCSNQVFRAPHPVPEDLLPS